MTLAYLQQQKKLCVQSKKEILEIVENILSSIGNTIKIFAINRNSVYIYLFIDVKFLLYCLNEVTVGWLKVCGNRAQSKFLTM